MTKTDETVWEKKYTGGSRFADGSAIIRPVELPWTDGPLEGLQFKLTHVDRALMMWTALIKAGPNAKIPAHFNYGEVQIYVLEGSLAFEGYQLGPNDYFLDEGGPVAERKAGAKGVTYFVMYNGGLSAIDRDKKPTGRFIDCNALYDLAAANKAADHLPSPRS